MTRVTLDPVQPYSLAQSAGGRNPSRRVWDGVVEAVFEAGGEPAHARVWQRRDGRLGAAIESAAPADAVRQLRFLLAVDADHRPFLRLAASDPLLRGVVGRSRGLRPMRVGTVAQALLKAISGQLIAAQEAWRIERRITERIGRPHAGLLLPPTAADLRRLSAAELVRLGLAPRRAAALARVVRQLDLERLRELETHRVVARIERERTLGPWSAGVIAVYGLGRFDHGLVGDLGLIRLCTALLGRPASSQDTAALLGAYGLWSGLAGVHLLRHPLAHRRAAKAA